MYRGTVRWEPGEKKNAFARWQDVVEIEKNWKLPRKGWEMAQEKRPQEAESSDHPFPPPS